MVWNSIFTIKGNIYSCVIDGDWPSSDFDIFASDVQNILDKFFNVKCPIILAGDFTVDFASDSQQVCRLRNIILTFNLVDHVKEPTRSQGISARIIDMCDY